MPKQSVELSFIENSPGKALEVHVPKGISHKDLQKITLGDLISKFRPKGCQTCLSGMDLRIRERLGRVVTINFEDGKLNGL